MANTELIDKPWLDILPPPAPLGDGPWLWLTIISVSLLVIAALFYLWRKQPRQQALHQLKRIQKVLESSARDNKQSLYKINRLLCHGLQQNSLARFTPPDELTSDWQVFYKQLTALQYNKTTPQTDNTRQLLLEAQGWLRRTRK